VATTYRNGEWGPASRTSNPRLPKRNPRPRKINGNDSGDRSTKPDASAVTVRTTAITPKMRRKSGNRHLGQIISSAAEPGFQPEHWHGSPKAKL
jgi:hypothetical protein